MSDHEHQTDNEDPDAWACTCGRTFRARRPLSVHIIANTIRQEPTR